MTNNRYGAPSLGNLAKRPKITAKLPPAMSGWSTTQTTPSAVCLYSSLMSRSTNIQSRSRYLQSSCRLSAAQPLVDRMRCVGLRSLGGATDVAGGSAPITLAALDEITRRSRRIRFQRVANFTCVVGPSLHRPIFDLIDQLLSQLRTRREG